MGRENRLLPMPSSLFPSLLSDRVLIAQTFCVAQEHSFKLLSPMPLPPWRCGCMNGIPCPVCAMLSVELRLCALQASTLLSDTSTPRCHPFSFPNRNLSVFPQPDYQQQKLELRGRREREGGNEYSKSLWHCALSTW